MINDYNATDLESFKSDEEIVDLLTHNGIGPKMVDLDDGPDVGYETLMQDSNKKWMGETFSKEQQLEFIKAIEDLEKELAKEAHYLQSMSLDMEFSHPMFISDHCYYTAFLMEQTYLHMKNLCSFFGVDYSAYNGSGNTVPENVAKYLKKIRKNSIYMKNGKDFFYFRLPELMSLNGYGNNLLNVQIDNSIRDMVFDMSMKYAKEHLDFKPFKKYTVVFIHHFEEEYQNSKRKDTDNYTVKKPIDGMNGVLIENDAADNSHVLQFTVPGKKAYTEMYLIKGHKYFDEIKKNLPNLPKGDEKKTSN